MKVILLADIRGTGRKDDVKEVREGYARNFLIPRGLAKVATEDVLAEKQAADEARGARREIRRREAEEIAGKLSTTTLSFAVKVGAHSEVFGSVTAKDLEHALMEKGFQGVTAELPRPLKTLGDHRIELDLGEGIKTALTITIVSE